MGATSNEEQPFLPRHGGSSRQQKDENTWCACLFVTVPLVSFASILPFCWYMDVVVLPPPEYTVAITSVSGLSPVYDTKQGGVLINPVFNLTVGIASKNKWYGACIDPHTILKVSYSYLHLPLAAGSVPNICVVPLESSDLHPVVARGSNVAVPGFLIDTLAEEMRNEEDMFEVKLNTYDDERRDWSNVLTRWVVVGDAAGRPGPDMHSIG